ncbi:thiamine pyrophosphate-dependent enzyme [Nocardia takedensis]|uniref:thiamine pyrophosphate-dependent enzyme n=1 Tax=Nocardia takedensis TaxID=259390 RepID=UPI0002F234BF
MSTDGGRSAPDDRGVDLDRRWRTEIAALAGFPPRALESEVAPGVSGPALLELFEAQAISRHLDLTARELGRSGRGYYSIGSSGHEGNAALAAALRVTDPALLHYRSGALFAHRAARVGADPIRDVLLGVVAAAADPISGGRHKVFGSVAAHIVPQTSTIASHLPRALGLAFALGRAARLGLASGWPADSVVLCTFGDASANHSTAVGAINAALHTAYQGVPVPLLFVCEDNGLGISVPTPAGWIESAYGTRPGLRYFDADGCDPVDALTTCAAAAEFARTHRTPTFLRLRTVRLLGHAGSDVESAYRSPAEITADLTRDPVLATAKLLVTAGVATAEEVIRRYDAIAERVRETAADVLEQPPLASAAAVIEPLAPTSPDRVRADVLRPHSTPTAPVEPAQVETHVGGGEEQSAPGRAEASGGRRESEAGRPGGSPRDAAMGAPVTMAQAINRTLADLLERDRDVLVFGEDVGRKGGVYGVTKGLRARFGARRVFDTLLDEQSVLGTALGAGLAGFVPIPEIQYLAYTHNALDQIRGEAATLGFFSAGRFRNPMVVRVAGLGYQKGFGGHFHNDNSLAALRDIPGVIVAVPSRADDAAAMLRTCVSAARVDGRVCVFVEPIALYHTRDLHPGDGAWLAAADGPHIPVGRAGVHGAGGDLTVVSFGNGVPMSLRAAGRLARDGIGVRVLDLRWLNPLPTRDLLDHARATGRVLIADETRRGGAVSDSVVAALVDAGFTGRIARVTSADSFVPLGPAAAHVLLDETAIERAARDLVAERERGEARPTLLRRFGFGRAARGNTVGEDS